MHRQFTATAIVVDSQRRILLLWHHKYQKWMPPGGHMDQGEIPEEAAIRECKEEVGIDIEILSTPSPDFFAGANGEGRILKQPRALLLEDVKDHQHIDFVYLARPIDETQILRVNAAEGSDARWFTQTEIEAMEPPAIFVNLKALLLHILSSERGESVLPS